MTDVSTSLVQAAYIVAALLFILALAGLSKHETARDGNMFGIVGMGIALVATIWLAPTRCRRGAALGLLVAVAMAIGATIGIWRAPRGRDDRHARADRDAAQLRRPAAVLVGSTRSSPRAGRRDSVHLVEVFLGVFIGAVTFTGSIVAFLKLSARISSKPLMLPARHWLNLGCAASSRPAASSGSSRSHSHRAAARS